MAKSEFLKLQDKNNDGLIDECGDQPIVPEEKPCPECKPDPYAITPNWKTKGNDEPWLNKQICAYQVTITTSYESSTPSAGASDSVANAYINGVFKEYVDTAVESLIVNFNKKLDDDSKKTVKSAIEYTKFDLDFRLKSRLVLLYSVPSYVIDSLEEDDNTEDEEEQEPTPTGATVTYEPADSMSLKMMRIRKALHLYNRYYTVHRYMNGGTIVLDGGKVFNLEDYGDNGFWGDSYTSQILPAIDAFLNSKGLDIPKSSSGTRGGGFWKKKISKLTITFDPEYKITKIEAFVGSCKEPQIFTDKKLKSLNKSSPFSDTTAMAYFAQMDEMHRAITSREPMPWMEFLVKFTKPSGEEIFNYRSEENEKDPKALTCIADRLSEDINQIGMNILDEAFGIGDAIAYQFNKQVCQEDLEAVEDNNKKLGLRENFKETRQDFKNSFKDLNKLPAGTAADPDKTKSLKAFAQEQAYKEIQKDQMSFEMLCAQFTGLTERGDISMEDIFSTTFDRMKLCGFQALLLDTMQCLMSGLTLDKALGKLAQSALSAMSIENFGFLFIGLSADKQARLEALVRQKIESGEAFSELTTRRHGHGDEEETTETPEGAGTELAEADSSEDSSGHVLGVSREAWSAAGTKAKNVVIKPWENAKAVKQDRAARRNSPEDDQAEKRTIAQQFDLQTAKEKLNTNVVMQAYASALIDEYSDDLLSLIDKLNEFPGAPIIAGIIAALDCPTSPIFEPTAVDFIKDLQLPFCRTPKGIQVPVIKNPFGWYPGKADFSKALADAVKLALQKAIIEIMMKIMIKTCEIFGRAICKGLEVMGDMIKEKATGGDSTFKDLVKDAICGPDADDDQVNDTINDLMNTLGPGGAALANPEEARNFTKDVSSATTRKEMTSAMLGDCSEDFLAIVDTIIEFEYPQYRAGLPTKKAICRFFTNVGNLVPPKDKQGMKDFVDMLPDDEVVPANPSLCITDEQQEEFCSMRQELMAGRATPEQIRQMCEDAQDEDGNDLAAIGGAMQKGGPGELPPIVSQPGCNDGLIPFESEEAVNATVATIMNGMEQLKNEYVKDMLGHGGYGIFNSDDDWGMINLILSDTRGNPLTVHNKKAARSMGPVMDYTTNESLEALDFANIFFFFQKPMPSILQHSALPTQVATWMTGSLQEHWGIFRSTNDWLAGSSIYLTFDQLEFSGWFGTDVDLTKIPDQGYNTELKPIFGTEGPDGSVKLHGDSVEIFRKGRKGTSDLTVGFRDNDKGQTKDGTMQYGDHTWEYGFDIHLYLSDMFTPPVGKPAALDLLAGSRGKLSSGVKVLPGKIVNIPNNNSRIVIENVENDYPVQSFPRSAIFFGLKGIALAAAATVVMNKRSDKEVRERKFEFFAVDDTLNNIRFRDYPKLLSTFQETNDRAPQLILLQELIEQNKRRRNY